MITIHEVSDLHLHPMRELVPFPGGDVLLLAGDIVEYHELSDSLTRSKFDVFCAEASQKYSKVFAILGNHEMYGTHRDNAVQAFKTIYKDFSIQLLNDEAVPAITWRNRTKSKKNGSSLGPANTFTPLSPVPIDASCPYFVISV